MSKRLTYAQAAERFCELIATRPIMKQYKKTHASGRPDPYIVACNEHNKKFQELNKQFDLNIRLSFQELVPKLLLARKKVDDKERYFQQLIRDHPAVVVAAPPEIASKLSELLQLLKSDQKSLEDAFNCDLSKMVGLAKSEKHKCEVMTRKLEHGGQDCLCCDYDDEGRQIELPREKHSALLADGSKKEKEGESVEEVKQKAPR